jgi:hypothetical protein
MGQSYTSWMHRLHSRWGPSLSRQLPMLLHTKRNSCQLYWDFHAYNQQNGWIVTCSGLEKGKSSSTLAHQLFTRWCSRHVTPKVHLARIPIVNSSALFSTLMHSHGCIVNIKNFSWRLPAPTLASVRLFQVVELTFFCTPPPGTAAARYLIKPRISVQNIVFYIIGTLMWL